MKTNSKISETEKKQTETSQRLIWRFECPQCGGNNVIRLFAWHRNSKYKCEDCNSDLQKVHDKKYGELTNHV